MDSRLVDIFRLIKNLLVRLFVYPVETFTMDMVVANVFEAWGMLLFKKWGAMMGGNMQLDISYVIIHIALGQNVRLEGKKYLLHIDDPNQTVNGVLTLVDDDMGTSTINVALVLPTWSLNILSLTFPSRHAF